MYLGDEGSLLESPRVNLTCNHEISTLLHVQRNMLDIPNF